ncbi:hypothetical protein DFQ01_11064 [Paenibacillus cellulosilyticus]|uniref:Uncharacterized protein n=1 Tax=Paenibacillus cellulosilyticus TaxID=375489 RepID=A0A2V2YW59_9BACL|nr:hypothetical protein [Paenibacillus cellulosilyticus]PWW01174.1 hypothetical protein DFQ01_11064 [Paenibacillus cellulosilyticus]QKS46865.1 hypothetical protein HUB94_20495 [Paenibacillus cellulosilyticus]
MKKRSSRKEIQRGNIVEEYMIGNTTIKIDDFYFRDNTPEQNQAIINNFYATGMRIHKLQFARLAGIGHCDSEVLQ